MLLITAVSVFFFFFIPVNNNTHCFFTFSFRVHCFGQTDEDTSVLSCLGICRCHNSFQQQEVVLLCHPYCRQGCFAVVEMVVLKGHTTSAKSK